MLHVSIKNSSMFLLFALLLSSFSVAKAEDIKTASNLTDLTEMSLEELLNVEVSVASKTSVNIRKTAGIVTLISSDEIKNSGARDLQDVLELVPGIVFNTDTSGTTCIGIRGLWGAEGKVLILIDGQEFNDVIWSITPFSNHFPVDQIKKVEVLRGPGSSIYGGQAELAVINVITKTAAEINGVSAKVNLGGMVNNPLDYTHRNLSISAGKEFDDFSIVAHAQLGLGNLSNRTYTDFYGNSFNLMGNSGLNSGFFNTGLNYKDLSARFIADIYRRDDRTVFSFASPKLLTSIHDGYYGEIKYNWKINDMFTLIPKLNFRQQYPFNMNNETAKELEKNPNYTGVFSDRVVKRYTANATLFANPLDNLDITAGSEYYYDTAEALDPLSNYNGKNFISFSNLSGFAEGLFKTEYANISLGLREEFHSAYGASFVPRAAITSQLGDFHAKLLYSKAFKAPSILNIILFKSKNNDSDKIKAENTTVMEFETGYQFTDNMFFTANLYDISISDPIVYYHDEGEYYDNFDRIGTRGVEFTYKYKDNKWGYADLTYSFYTPNDNKVIDYAIPNNNTALLGFPNHKATLNGSINVWENLYINPSAIFYGNKFAYGSIDNNENGVIKEFSPVLLLNLNLTYKDLLTKNLNLSLTAFNLLNQNYMYVQPYNSLHAPIPGPTTEIALAMEYSF